jgi:large subunit ribosomal protein L27
MAHTKAKGSTQLGRDSKSKRLGVKIFGNQKAKNGQIIVRQRGTKYIAGENAKTGKDHTIFASTDGIVQFKKINKKTFSGKTKKRQLISIK